MDALRYLIRATFDRRALRGALLLAVVIGLAAGVGLAGVAGSRRTASAYARYLDAAHASDLELNVFSTGNDDTTSPSDLRRLRGEIAALPGVAETSTYVGLESVLPVDSGGRPLELSHEIVGSLDGRFFDMDRAAVTEGRLPRLDRDDEVLVTQPFAEEAGVGVGDHLRLNAYSLEALATGDEDAEPVDTVTARIVGVGLLPDEVLSDEADRYPRILAPPALTERFAEAQTYFWQGIGLDPGADIDEVVAESRRVAREADPSNFVQFERTSSRIDRVQRAVRPTSWAVAIVAGMALAAAVALALLGSARLAAQIADTAEPLRPLGVSPRLHTLVIAAPSLVALLLGTGGAIVGAVALSPLAPFGAVSSVEADPGVDVDLAVLAVGGLVFAAVLVAGLLLVARREQRRGRGAPVVSSGGRLVGRVTSTLPLAVMLGARHALERDRARTGVPRMTALVACTVAVTAIVGALTYAAGLRGLLDSPALYGSDFDVALPATVGYGAAPEATVRRLLDRDPDVTGWELASFTQLERAGTVFPAIATRPGAEIGPRVLKGRAPARDGEIALGVRTARTLGADVGDVVTLGGERYGVVGLTALPAMGPFNSEHPSLGTGVWIVIPDGVTSGDELFPSTVMVDLAPHAPASTPQRLADELSEALPGEYFEHVPPQRPAELVDGNSTSGTITRLAWVLGLAALVAVGATVSTSVRRWRRDLAVLKTLGVRPRTAGTSVHVQATTIVLGALVAGVPLGWLAGRVAWSRFADTIGAAPSSPVPVLGVTIVAAVLMVMVNVIALAPARRARHVAPSDTLRAS